MYKCQSLSCVHCSKDVGALSPSADASADVRINLPEDNCLILCLPLQNFQKQLGVVGRITLVRGALWILELKVRNSIPLNRFGEVGAGCWKSRDYSHWSDPSNLKRQQQCLSGELEF